MTNFTDIDDAMSKVTGSNFENRMLVCSDYVAGTIVASQPINIWNDLWLYSRSLGAGVLPGTTARIPTNATAGSIGQADPGGGRQKFLLSAGMFNHTGGGSAFMLYDRLLDVSGLDATSAIAQTVGGTISRYTSATDAVGSMIFVVIYQQIGTTARTISASYSNENGASGHTTGAVTFGGAAASINSTPYVMLELPLAAGDLGVTAVASVTVSATTGTAGNFGVVVAHPLEIFGGYGGVGGDFNFIEQGCAAEIKTGACLALASMASATTPLRFGMLFHMVES